MTTAYDFEPLPPELDCLAIDPAPLTLSEDELLRMYRAMRLARIFETRLASLYRQGKIIGAIYLGTGQEAIATGVASLMDRNDIFSTVSRSLAAWFYRGVEPKHVIARWFGKDVPPSHGRDLGLFPRRPRNLWHRALSQRLDGLLDPVRGRLRFGVQDEAPAECLHCLHGGWRNEPWGFLRKD